MRLWLGVGLPLAILVSAISFPLVRYFLREPYERQAIEFVRAVQDAQRAFSVHADGYATNVTTLVTPCGNVGPVLARSTLDDVTAAGYAVELRPARDAVIRGVDCNGHPLASDYYVAVRPASPRAVARQALASRSNGAVYLFHDGIPPREEDIERGLATLVDVRETFRIP